MSGGRDFAALALAQVFSISATRLSMIAIPWLVLTLSGDPLLTGIVVFAEMAPYVLAKALGGPLIDRIGPRRISILGDLAAVPIVGAVPVLFHFDLLAFPVLIALVVLLGSLRGPADAAVHAMVPMVARRSNAPLERVTGVVGTIERLASTVGAGAAGGLVALIGAAPALAFNAVALALSALVVMIGIGREPQRRPPEDKTSYRAELGEGFNFLRRDVVLIAIAVMVACSNLFDQAYATVLVPVWIKSGGMGAEILGLIFAVMAGFSMLGAMLATALGEKMPRLIVYTAAYMLIGIPRFAVFALDAPMAVILVTLAIGGFASGFLNPILSAVILERIPERLIGRVSSLVTASAWALMPFGGIVGGALIAGAGLSNAMWIAGGCYFAITLLPLCLPGFRQFAKRPQPAG